MITFSDITVPNEPALLPSEAVRKRSPEFWEQGFEIIRGAIPVELIDEYCDWRSQLSYGPLSPTLYMQHEIVRKLCLHDSIVDAITRIIGEPMGVHLNLSGWYSTERNWHQDTYLNPIDVAGFYLASWIALEDIHPDSGVLQLVPGSHRWNVVSTNKVQEIVKNDPVLNIKSQSLNWVYASQDFVSRVFEDEIAHRSAEVYNHVPKKGDVLLWHAFTAHRGSEPKQQGMLRKALISHYSALSKRHDMKIREQYGKGWYFKFPKN